MKKEYRQTEFPFFPDTAWAKALRFFFSKKKETKEIAPPPQRGAGMRGKIEFILICKYFPLKCPFSADINWTELPLPAGAGKPIFIH